MTTEILPTETPGQLTEAVNRAVELLNAGEAVALPTETVYGLAANALNPDAVAKIFAAKERPSFDPLIVHIARRHHLTELAVIPQEIADAVEKIVGALWPGPLTVVLPKTAAVPDLVTSGLPTVAIRMPAHPIFRRVLRDAGFPLAAPSANRFGRISPTSASAVVKELEGRIPLIVDGGACFEGLESTIVRIHPPLEGKTRPQIEILRAGPVTKEQLREFGQVRFAKKARARSESDASPAAETPEVPGQLASHYAPQTPLRVLEPGDVFQPEPGRRYGLLSYTGEPKKLNLAHFAEVAALSPGSGKLQEAAIRFFAVLRQLDEAGVDETVEGPVSEVGLGVAIMDRLRRAAVKRG